MSIGFERHGFRGHRAIAVAVAVAVGASTLALALWVLPPNPRPGPAHPSPTARAAPLEPPTRPALEARSKVSPPMPGEPPAVEPSTELPPPVEPTAEDVAELMVEVPFGTLQILVLDGRVPAAGARVLVHGRRPGGPPERENELAPHGFSGVTDPRGLVTFWGVPGDTYDVRVMFEPFPVQQVAVLHAPNRHARVVVAFGGSALRGHVWDEEGQPLTGCVVTAEIQWPPYPGQTLRAWTYTATDGSYLLDGLISNGSYSLRRSCGVPDEHSIRIGLAAGEEKVVDFGAASGLARWSGTVRDTRDLPVPGPGWVEIERRENAALSGFRYDEQGRFSVGLLPGTYSVRVPAWEGALSLALVKIAHDDVEFDLNVPGTRVVAHLSYYGTWPRAEEVTGRVGISLGAPEGRWALPNIRAGTVRTFLGVPPGEYELQCWPNPITGAPEGRMPIRVEEGNTSIVVEVTVGDP